MQLVYGITLSLKILIAQDPTTGIAIENKEDNNYAMFVRCQQIIKHLENDSIH